MNNVDTSIKNLRAIMDEHQKMGAKIMRADSGKIFTLDLFVVLI